MRGITISDVDPRGVLAFDLHDLLEVLDPAGRASEWELRDVECVDGASADALHAASDSGNRMVGEELVRLAHDIGQVVDGEFRAFRPGEPAPWIVIRAVDSSAFDVETDREDIIASLEKRFSKVARLPS